MLLKKIWKHKITSYCDYCNLFGVNIFDYKWSYTGEKITIKDPLYHQIFDFDIFTVDINGVSKKFAAGEFSNCVWGFYLEEK